MFWFYSCTIIRDYGLWISLSTLTSVSINVLPDGGVTVTTKHIGAVLM